MKTNQLATAASILGLMLWPSTNSFTITHTRGTLSPCVVCLPSVMKRSHPVFRMSTMSDFPWDQPHASDDSHHKKLPDGRFHSDSTTSSSSSSSSHSSSHPTTNPRRWERLRKEQEIRSRFVVGDDLHRLRHQVQMMRDELGTARKLSATRRIQELEGAIVKAQQMDAEFIYSVALERMEAAQQLGRFDQAEGHRRQAMEARSALPQFNLEGLWVGKYGEQGYEMINITYVGDTLVAHKVTGDRNVPKGQISFQVDLSPRSIIASRRGLEPIELGDKAANQWGTKFLERFVGEGQVAHPGFVNAQWMDGQLILVGQYFSFAWLPIGYQVFFGRPSAELTLKLLRQSRERTSNHDKLRAHLFKCMDETEHLLEEMESSSNHFHEEHISHTERYFE